MAFPLVIHMNSSRRALAPHIFLPILGIEIFVDILLLLALPVIACAVTNAAGLHPNFRIINISTILHYAAGVVARFVIIFYELNDVAVSKEDWLLFTADIIRDQMLGYFISLLGVISFERYIATRYWEWYEGRGPRTLWIAAIAEFLGSGPSLINVLLCEYDYYPHETNFVVFAVILLASGILYAIAYTDNTRVLRSLNNFSSPYTVNQLFQVKENLRVLKFTAIFISFSIPVMTLSFGFYAVFFFAPPAWEKERFLCMALFDFCISVYAPAYFFIAVRGVREYHREIFKIRSFKLVATLFGWKAPSKESVVELSSRIDGTKAYFEELAKAWTGSARTFPV